MTKLGTHEHLRGTANLQPNRHSKILLTEMGLWIAEVPPNR
jgi:hypothetical protein